MISGRFGDLPYNSMPSRNSREPAMSVNTALNPSRPSDVAICHAGMTAPETAETLSRNIILVAAVGGNSDMPTASGELGVLRNTIMTQNGQTFRMVR